MTWIKINPQRQLVPSDLMPSDDPHANMYRLAGYAPTTERTMTAEDIYGHRKFQPWRTDHSYDGKFNGRIASYWHYRDTGWYICHGSLSYADVGGFIK